jgi:2-(3-amino-3-carboxypropyl)histidine synthase
MHDLAQERVAREIKERKATTVLLQLPDGLRPTAFTLAQTLTEQTGAEIIISGDSCYGACDLALTQAQ